MQNNCKISLALTLTIYFISKHLLVFQFLNKVTFKVWVGLIFKLWCEAITVLKSRIQQHVCFGVVGANVSDQWFSLLGAESRQS